MTDAGTAFALYLASEGFGTAGVNIFANNRPSKPSAVVVCTEYGGSAPDMPMGGGRASLTHPGLQITVRGSSSEDYDVVHARAMGMWEIIHQLTEITLSGDRYVSVTPTDQPALINKDDDERLLFAMNFDLVRG